VEKMAVYALRDSFFAKGLITFLEDVRRVGTGTGIPVAPIMPRAPCSKQDRSRTGWRGRSKTFRA